MAWSDLADTAVSGVKFCGHCRLDVYLVRSRAEFEHAVGGGRCVGFERQDKAGATSQWLVGGAEVPYRSGAPLLWEGDG